MAFDVEHEFRLLSQRVATVEGYLTHVIAECNSLRAALKTVGVDVDESLGGLGDELDDHAFSLNELREQVDQAATKDSVVAATEGALHAAQEIAHATARAQHPRVVVKTVERDAKGRITGVVERVKEWGDTP
jgi:hypothetical protein